MTHIAGGSDLPGDPLRQRVRERLADGRLFRVGRVSVVRKGSGRPCNVCGKSIAKGGNEREVQGPGHSFGLAHEACYQVWREETRRIEPPRARDAADDPS